MDKNLIEKYKAELMKMYRSSGTKYAAVPVSETSGNDRKATPAPQTENDTSPQFGDQKGVYDSGTPSTDDNSTDPNGRLAVMVTAISSIYPVPNARVTVFTGDVGKMQVIDSGMTDESGKTKVFELSAPPRQLSMQSGMSEQPYALYNISVKADGFVENIHLNIPVFRGVTSLQRSNLLPNSAGNAKSPVIYDESSRYGL